MIRIALQRILNSIEDWPKQFLHYISIVIIYILFEMTYSKIYTVKCAYSMAVTALSV